MERVKKIGVTRRLAFAFSKQPNTLNGFPEHVIECWVGHTTTSEGYPIHEQWTFGTFAPSPAYGGHMQELASGRTWDHEPTVHEVAEDMTRGLMDDIRAAETRLERARRLAQYAGVLEGEKQ